MPPCDGLLTLPRTPAYPVTASLGMPCARAASLHRHVVLVHVGGGLALGRLLGATPSPRLRTWSEWAPPPFPGPSRTLPQGWVTRPTPAHPRLHIAVIPFVGCEPHIHEAKGVLILCARLSVCWEHCDHCMHPSVHNKTAAVCRVCWAHHTLCADAKVLWDHAGREYDPSGTPLYDLSVCCYALHLVRTAMSLGNYPLGKQSQDLCVCLAPHAADRVPRL